MTRLVRAWLLTAVADGCFAMAQTALAGRSIARLWQYVASVPFGRGMIDSGAGGVALGLATHFSVALAWSLVMFLIARRFPGLLSTRGRVFLVALVYGPLVWIVMSCAVIPRFSHQLPALDGRWLTQLVGHAFSVGLPICWSLSDPSPERPRSVSASTS
jgi:hypothetical protein